MRAPTMHEPRRVTSDVDLLGAWAPVPGHGVLAVNSFVIHAPEPVLVDTGLAALGGRFMAALEQTIDPASLRWIWITHPDADHVGNLGAVLERAPHARVVASRHGLRTLAAMRLPLARERLFLLDPGQRLQVGDRELLAVEPPIMDTAETTGLLDTGNGVLFSADCFGAVLPAPVAEASQVGNVLLKLGTAAWARAHAGSPARQDRRAFVGSLEAIRRLAATTILGSHLPPARAMTERLLQFIADAAEAPLLCAPELTTIDGLFTDVQPLAA